MKYLLGIGPTILQKYKKDANVRVFLDDLLVDDFFVAERNITEKRWFDDKNVPMNPWKPSPTPIRYKTYIFDQSTLDDKKKLRLEVINDDSNYTNGFMTKSTVIDFRHIFLLPIQFLNFFKLGALQMSDAYFTMCKNLSPIMHEKFKGQLDFVRFVYKHRDFCYYGYPYPYRYFWNGEETFGQLGGSGSLHIDLIKRSGIHMFDSIDEDIPDEDLFVGGQHYRAPRILDYTPHPDDQPQPSEDVKITGFQLARLFLFWCKVGIFDKYLYEDK